MNLPNKLTVTRLVLAPVLFLFYFSIDVLNISPVAYSVILCLLYGVMELTDLLDGKIARKHNLVTDLGKVMDPFGDVICHLSFFTLFLVSGYMPVLPFAVILWREFSQSFTRMLLMGRGTPMAANIFGKAKTCLYAFCSVLGFGLKIAEVNGIGEVAGSPSAYLTVRILFCLAAVSSVLSYLIYMAQIKKSGVLKGMTR